jgi:hypothetical protein
LTLNLAILYPVEKHCNQRIINKNGNSENVKKSHPQISNIKQKKVLSFVVCHLPSCCFVAISKINVEDSLGTQRAL